MHIEEDHLYFLCNIFSINFAFNNIIMN